MLLTSSSSLPSIHRRLLLRTVASRKLLKRSLGAPPGQIKKAPLAFAFDIDGVLIRGANVLPEAKRALSILEGNNPLGIKIPYILLTNGGGISEEHRSRKLSEQLGYQINPEQYIQSHTVLKSLAHKYESSPVLVLGGKNDTVRKVAEGYGLNQVYTSLDVLRWNPSVWPFHSLSPEERQSTKQADFSQIPISAIFVFHDPRNWALDVQIACDVIRSGGYLGRPYLRNPLQEAKPPVELIFCNPDLIWRSDFDCPRLGQGAFKEAFQAVYKALTGTTYPCVQFGKPSQATYSYAASVLAGRSEELLGDRSLPQIYMIGDNPESDIAGANAANWSSILVHTGVYDPAQGPPRHQPTSEARDVEQAVIWAIEREFRGVAR